MLYKGRRFYIKVKNATTISVQNKIKMDEIYASVNSSVVGYDEK